MQPHRYVIATSDVRRTSVYHLYREWVATSGINPWNRALVTGASSGIGRDMCKILSSQGTDLVVVARREDRLNELADSLNVDVEIMVADLSSQADLEKLSKRLEDESKPIDLLINNAGIQNFGSFTDLDLEKEKTVIQVNINALHTLCHVASRVMKERRHGWILNVSSITGFAPYPRSATYGGTKAFVTNFSEALQAELAPFGVIVSALCPGPTRTEIQTNATIDLNVLPDFLITESPDVAAVGLSDFAKKKPVIVPGAPMKVTRGLIKVLPGAAIRKISDYISSKR